MLPSLAEIAFACAHCEGPLIAWESDAGRGTDCPHCLKAITVPSVNAQVIDKNTFEEPSGLRRILMEVRDQEWESMRRKLRVAKAQNAWLEEELRKARDGEASPASAAETSTSPKDADAARLRAELAAMQQKNAELERTTRTLRAELEQFRAESVTAREELRALQRQLEEHEAADRLRAELAHSKLQRAGRRTPPAAVSALA